MASTSSSTLGGRDYLGMRRELYRRSTMYGRGQPTEYVDILHSRNATDPLCTETETPLDEADDNAELRVTSPPRERWSNLVPFIFSSYCNSLAFSSMTSSLLCYFAGSHVGNGFFIPFLIGWVFVIVPLLALEYSFGQIFQGGVGKVFSIVGKRTPAIGLAAVLLLLVDAPMHARFLGELLLYALTSIQKQLPWQITADMTKTCESTLDDLACDALYYCTTCEELPGCFAAHFKAAAIKYDDLLGNKSGRSTGFLDIDGYLLIAVVVGVIIVAAISLGTLRVYGQFATFAGFATLVYFLFMSLIGGPSLFKSSFFSIFKLNGPALRADFPMWHQALAMVISSSGTVFGSQYILASFNPVSKNVLKVPSIICLMRILTSLISGVAFFSLLSEFNPSTVDDLGRISVVVDRNDFAVGALDTSSVDIKPFNSAGLPTNVIDTSSTVPVFGETFFCTPHHWTPLGFTLDLDSAHRSLFISLPIALGMMTAAPVHSVFMFGVLLASAIVSNAAIYQTVVDSFIGSDYFSKLVSNFTVHILVGLWWIIATIPFVLIYPTVPTDGRHLLNVWTTTLRSIVIPAVGCVHIFTLLSAISWDELIKFLHPYTQFLLYGSFAVAGVTGFGVAWSFSGTTNYVVAMAVGLSPLIWIALIVLAVGLTFLIDTRKPARAEEDVEMTLWTKLRLALYGDAAAVRRKLNRLLTTGRPWERLPAVWAPVLKILTPAIFLSIIFGSVREAAEEYTEISIGLGVIFLCLVGVLMSSSFIKPKWFTWMHPSPINTWKLVDLPEKKQRARVVLRRKPVRFWEEFRSAQTTWDMAGEVEIHRVR